MSMQCLIAGGTFNGEVVVWDLSRDGDAQAAKSYTLSDARHREPISAVTWLYSGSDMRRHGSQALAYRLASLGRDGRLLVWLWNKMENPVYGCVKGGYVVFSWHPTALIVRSDGAAADWCTPLGLIENN